MTPVPLNDLIADIEAALAAMTPGPLEVDAVASEHLHDIIMGYRIEGSGYPVLVASMFHDEQTGRPGDISAREADANARGFVTLRNRVPDLLALLRQAVDVVRPLRRCKNQICLASPCKPDNLCSGCRAAAWLAAVEGGAK